MSLMRSLFSKKQKITQLKQPFNVEVLFVLFDVFYVCFDEPNRKENWDQIKSIIPKAKKVEGVVGFDQALKECAKQSSTDYFFLIDGDNQLMERRFRRSLSVENIQDDWVLSWASLNTVNGLTYGNGGLKLWPKDVALNINSHENADSEDDQTDYCFIASYYLVDDYVSRTIINKTYKQAFRAGFREGVKMSLAYGKQVDFNQVDFETTLGRQNRLRLKIWCEVGADVLNGMWAILGARMGLYYNAVRMFDYKGINSYEWIESLLQEDVFDSLDIRADEVDSGEFDVRRLAPVIEQFGEKIKEKLPMDLKLLTPIESLKFKEEFQNPSRSGLLN